MSIHHRIRVVGIVRHEGRILLVKQFNPYKNEAYWALPGGGFEASDSSIFAAVEREVWEETGVQVRAGDIRFVREYLNTGTRPLLMLSLYLECHDPQGAPHTDNTQVGDNVLEAAWWPIHDLKSNALPLANSLRGPEFWRHLEYSMGPVRHLGRTVDS